MYKNVNRILSKKQRKASKKVCEGYQNLSEEEKHKKLQYTEIVPKNKEMKTVSMVVNNIEIFQK